MLVIGLGSIARKHLAALRTLLPKVEVYALRSQRAEAAIEGVTNLYDFREAKFMEPDFVLLANPTRYRDAAMTQVIELGVPIFLEKPVSHSLQQVEVVLAQLEQAGVLTYVGCNLRFLDCLQYVRGALVQQQLVPNEVNVYCGSYLPKWRPGTDFRQSYSSLPALGGGVHLDLIHELDYLYWIFGQPMVVHSFKRSVSSLSIESVDYANYLLEYPDFAATVVLNYYRRDYRRQLEIVLPDDTWTVDLAANTVTDCSGNLLQQSTQRMLDTYTSQMTNFIRMIEGNPEVQENTYREGAAVLKIALHDE